jgi:membrane protein
MVWAAAMAYYSLLSIFPLLIAAAALAAFFVQPEWAVEQSKGLLDELFPTGGFEMGEVVKNAIEQRRNVSLVSMGFLLWTGSRIFGAMTRALNMATRVDETFAFWKRVANELLMTATVGLLFVLALTSRILLQWLWQDFMSDPDRPQILVRLLLDAVPALLLAAVLLLIYRLVPRRRMKNSALLAGALVATALFLIARPLFLEYLRWFSSYNLIYGSLAIVVVLLVWAWMVALMILYGGELAAILDNPARLPEGMPWQTRPARRNRRKEDRKPEAIPVSGPSEEESVAQHLE